MHQLGEWLAHYCGHHHHDTVATVIVSFSVNGVPMSDPTQLPEGDIQVQAVGLNAAGVPVPGITFDYATTTGTLVANPDGTEVLTNAPVGDVTVTATAPNGISGQATGTVVDSVVASVQVTLSPAPGAPASTTATDTPPAA